VKLISRADGQNLTNSFVTAIFTRNSLFDYMKVDWLGGGHSTHGVETHTQILSKRTGG